MRVYEVMDRDVETVNRPCIARTPVHVSNRAHRKAREERVWGPD